MYKLVTYGLLARKFAMHRFIGEHLRGEGIVENEIGMEANNFDFSMIYLANCELYFCYGSFPIITLIFKILL